MIDTIWTMAEARSQIGAVSHVPTIHTAPQSVFVALGADFEDSHTMGDGERLVVEGQHATNRWRGIALQRNKYSSYVKLFARQDPCNRFLNRRLISQASSTRPTT